MKRLAAVGVAGVDPAMSGPVVHTDAGAAPVGKVVEKRGGRHSGSRRAAGASSAAYSG
jgi:hypothetical protein